MMPMVFLRQELFKRVIPHQCLGAVWSRRDRDKGKIGKGGRSSEASSVAATVEQFNAVSYRVISTILIGSAEPRSQQRARVIAKWIDVAQVSHDGVVGMSRMSLFAVGLH